jgi:hypothetical protein
LPFDDESGHALTFGLRADVPRSAPCRIFRGGRMQL